MHERDFQKGAGGFLSGYRYLIRNLVHHLNEVDFGIPYPYMVLSSEKDVAFKVQTRLEAAADLIILQDGVIIRDAIVPVLDGDPGTYHYYEGISYDFHKDIVNRTDIIWVYFAWGDVRRSNHVFDGVYMYDDGGLLNIMLHPEVQVGNLTREILEDLEMAWRQPGWLHPTAKTVLQALRGDFDSWHPKEAYRYEVPYGRNSTKDDPYAKPRFQEGKGKGFEKNKFQQAIAVAVKDPTPTNLERLRSRMENSFPDLFDCHSQDADADTTKTE